MTNKQEKDIHFHCKEKGCIIKDIKIETVEKSAKGRLWMNCCYCKTHEVACCRCGWEWGWHGGTDNKAIGIKAKHNRKLTKKICNISKNTKDLPTEAWKKT